MCELFTLRYTQSHTHSLSLNFFFSIALFQICKHTSFKQEIRHHLNDCGFAFIYTYIWMAFGLGSLCIAFSMWFVVGALRSFRFRVWLAEIGCHFWGERNSLAFVWALWKVTLEIWNYSHPWLCGVLFHDKRCIYRAHSQTHSTKPAVRSKERGFRVTT